jgi:hypothetical protein
MFWMISIATGLCIYSDITKFVPVIDDERTVKQIKKKGILKATAVGMYISCVTPVIFFSPDFFGTLSNISPVFMLVNVALTATLAFVMVNEVSHWLIISVVLTAAVVVFNFIPLFSFVKSLLKSLMRKGKKA